MEDTHPALDRVVRCGGQWLPLMAGVMLAEVTWLRFNQITRGKFTSRESLDISRRRLGGTSRPRHQCSIFRLSRLLGRFKAVRPKFGPCHDWPCDLLRSSSASGYGFKLLHSISSTESAAENPKCSINAGRARAQTQHTPIVDPNISPHIYTITISPNLRTGPAHESTQDTKRPLLLVERATERPRRVRSRRSARVPPQQHLLVAHHLLQPA